MSLSEITRDKVRQRAENRCEYCLGHQNYILGRLQIDHIQPLSKGGVNTEDNLCLACELCIWGNSSFVQSSKSEMERSF
jgi:5-methylcytosine-specific restriction endonuclease McrA